jgi:hypothetical protein
MEQSTFSMRRKGMDQEQAFENPANFRHHLLHSTFKVHTSRQRVS